MKLLNGKTGIILENFSFFFLKINIIDLYYLYNDILDSILSQKVEIHNFFY